MDAGLFELNHPGKSILTEIISCQAIMVITMKTVTVELINEHALQLLQDLEKADLIRLILESKTGISRRFRGKISTQTAQSLRDQLEKIAWRMVKHYLTDTNVIIEYLSGSYEVSVLDWLDNLFEQAVNIFIINRIELLAFQFAGPARTGSDACFCCKLSYLPVERHGS